MSQIQTFLPYPEFERCAQVLDRQRLGKQRVETMQICKALIDPGYGWQSHPAVRMWRGHLGGLFHYQLDVCAEWISRGYKDTCFTKTLELVFPYLDGYFSRPPWITDELCRSHQSNLIRKDPAHYGPLFPGVPADLEYVWPAA